MRTGTMARGLATLAMIAFFAWCAVAFRGDLAQVRLDSLWTGKEVVLAAALLSLANYALRAARWGYYLARMGHPLPAGFTTVTYLTGFAFTLSPGKVGELVRGRYYHARGVPFSATAAAFFVERLLDLLAMVLLAVTAIALSARYALLVWAAVAAVALVFVVLAVVPWTRLQARLRDGRTLPAARLLRGIVDAIVSARVLLRPRALAVGFALAVVAWGAEGVGLWVIAPLSTAPSIGLAAAVGIYSLAVIAGALSFMPGGLGGTEAVMIALLAAHGYPMPDAILLTLVCRLLTLWLAVVIGWLAVLALRRSAAVEAPRA